MESAQLNSIVSIKGLTKTYDTGFSALKSVDLDIRQGRDFRPARPQRRGQDHADRHCLRPGASDGGTVLVDGHDIVRDYREARKKIGLVPQELATNMFETVWDTIVFSRGLFGKAPNPAHIERVLRDLSLWDKKDRKSRRCRAA